MLRNPMNRMLSWLDASLAALGHGFVRHWTQVERSYRRPMSRLASRLKFAFFPLLALGAMAWLGWDWVNRPDVRMELGATTQLPRWYNFSALPLAFALMAWHQFAAIVRDLRALGGAPA